MILEGKGPGLFNVGGGTIELTATAVVIRKKSADVSGGSLLSVAVGVAAASKGEFAIPYSSVSHVSISKGGWGTPPFIQVLSAGGRAIADSEEAIRAPDCLLFKKDSISEFEGLKAEIEKRAAASRNQSQPMISAVSAADEIRKLDELRKSGLLTDSEFDQKKKQILGL